MYPKHQPFKLQFVCFEHVTYCHTKTFILWYFIPSDETTSVEGKTFKYSLGLSQAQTHVGKQIWINYPLKTIINSIVLARCIRDYMLYMFWAVYRLLYLCANVFSCSQWQRIIQRYKPWCSLRWKKPNIWAHLLSACTLRYWRSTPKRYVKCMW